MNSRSRTSLIAKLLKDKEYRDAYVAEHVRNGVPFQIRTMRDRKGWTQARLGQEAGKPQNVISRLEDPNYGKVTIQTLLQIASAFDTALMVKFVPFSRLLKEYENVSPDALAVSSIQDEVPKLEQWATAPTPKLTNFVYAGTAIAATAYEFIAEAPVINLGYVTAQAAPIYEVSIPQHDVQLANTVFWASTNLQQKSTDDYINSYPM